MSDEHNHHHGDFAALRKKSKSAMITVLALTFSFMAVAVIGGIYTGSLALIADAGHMLADSAGLVLALLLSGLLPSDPVKPRLLDIIELRSWRLLPTVSFSSDCRCISSTRLISDSLIHRRFSRDRCCSLRSAGLSSILSV